MIIILCLFILLSGPKLRIHHLLLNETCPNYLNSKQPLFL